MRRALGDTLVDLMGAVGTLDDAALPRVTDVSIEVPIEVLVRRSGDGVEFLADLPRWRWTTVFDERPGRLKLRCAEGEMA